MGTKTKQLKGRVKQAAGALTGNKRLEREGAVERRSGEAKERIEKTADKVEQVIDKATDAVTGAIHTSRRGRRHT